jgi:3-methyl-2-oxobutanoate hydroxymethyltransferase
MRRTLNEKKGGSTAMTKLTVSSLIQMKAEGQKIMACVCYDNQIAQILDRAGVDILSAGDSGGRTAFGHRTFFEVTVDDMVIICRAVSRAASHAVVNCDMPFGPPQEGWQSALSAAVRLVKEGGAEIVKIDNGAANMDAVKAIAEAGIPVFPQFGFSPQSSMAIGEFMARTEDMLAQRRDQIFREAQELEKAGASVLDLTGVTHDMYAEVAKRVKIPVLGGQAGAEADGRIFTGFSPRAAGIDREPGPMNIGHFIYDAAAKQLADVRAGNF